MLLLIFGLYALFTAKMQISATRGLKGTGARVGGAICVAFALGLFSFFAVPLMTLSVMLGLGQAGTTIVGFVFQLVLLAIVFSVLLRVYGNAYAPDNRGIS